MTAALEPVTAWTVTFEFPREHPALRGHFPGNPVVPAVLILDEVLHRLESAARPDGAGVDRRAAAAPSVPASCWQIGSAKFHRPVRPGEPLALELEQRHDGGVRFSVRSSGQLIAQGVLRRAGERSSA